MSIQIWHNPRCSKSRQTMELLEAKGVTPEVKLYLDDAPTMAEIDDVLTKLGMEPRDAMRTKEDVYKELNLGNEGLSRDDLVKAMSENPKLIERPIVINGDKAKHGRPPEQVLGIL
ncbi:MAG: arsenate reductase (glutaredoxin) [Sphingomonadales bacterium]|nr:arsenate reductase (glutaredoxin) [Sphingomonadales bacterium]